MSTTMIKTLFGFLNQRPKASEASVQASSSALFQPALFQHQGPAEPINKQAQMPQQSDPVLETADIDVEAIEDDNTLLKPLPLNPSVVTPSKILSWKNRSLIDMNLIASANREQNIPAAPLVSQTPDIQPSDIQIKNQNNPQQNNSQDDELITRYQEDKAPIGDTLPIILSQNQFLSFSIQNLIDSYYEKSLRDDAQTAGIIR